MEPASQAKETPKEQDRGRATIEIDGVEIRLVEFELLCFDNLPRDLQDRIKNGRVEFPASVIYSIWNGAGKAAAIIYMDQAEAKVSGMLQQDGDVRLRLAKLRAGLREGYDQSSPDPSPNPEPET